MGENEDRDQFEQPAGTYWKRRFLILCAGLAVVSLTVVSSQATECSFNVGLGFLALVIKEGPVRLWSSADCVKGSGSLVSALRRGVPTVLPVTWNRRTSAPSCSGPSRMVPPGIYTAYAAQGGIDSVPVTFHLG